MSKFNASEWGVIDDGFGLKWAKGEFPVREFAGRLWKFCWLA